MIQNETDGATIGDIARARLAHFQEALDHRAHLTGPDLSLTADAAQTIAMAFHELATDAGKYGALSNETGRICETVDEITAAVSSRRRGWRTSWGRPCRSTARHR